MLNALKNVLGRSARAVSRGFVWWFEKLGEYPSLSRDPGIVAWQHLSARKQHDEESELPAGEVASKDSDDDGKRRPMMRRAAPGVVARVSQRRSLGALHQPAFVAVRIATRRSVRRAYRWDLGA